MFSRRCLATPFTAIAKQQQQQRTYFPVASAISALTSFGKPLHFHENRVLHYPKSALYKIVSDIKSYPQFLPGLEDARILALARSKSVSSDSVKEAPALASLTIGISTWAEQFGFNGRTACFVSNVYCLPERGIVEAVAGRERQSKALNAVELSEHGYDENVLQDHEIDDMGPDLFNVCRTRWMLTELDKTKTEVDLRIEIDWRNKILATATQAALPTMAEKMIVAFEKRARDTLHTS